MYLFQNKLVNLPARMRLPDGSTRTDLGSLTDTELAELGYTLPPAQPEYNPLVEQCNWVNGGWNVSPLPTTEEEEWAWYIDIGAFFDRFDTAKLDVLTSAHPLVSALVKDCQTRKWIDLKRPDVAQGLYAMQSIGISSLTEPLINSILNTPVSDEENFALRKIFFNA